jgi:hypothetical protein
MYVSVGGLNAPASSLAVEKMTASRADDGSAVVMATIHNTGGRAIDTTANVTLAAVGATLTAGPYDSVESVTIAPGDTAQVPISITDDIDAGPWLATVVATSGPLVVSAESTLTFPAAGSGDAVAATASDPGVPVWVWVAMLLAIALCAVLVVYLYRRRIAVRRLVEARESAPPAEEAPDRLHR